MDFTAKVAKIEADAARAIQIWNAEAQKLCTLNPTLQEEAGRLRTELQHGYETMLEELSHPTIRIATAGTTSSGKSSLLNFLCGVPVLPTAVQEKSAGIVRIVHAEKPRLVIEETPGSQWSCGEYKDIDYPQIYELLDTVMDTYRKYNKASLQVADSKYEDKDECRIIAPPQATVYYPFSLKERIGLDENYQIELVDLPGLKYCGDTLNREGIRSCRNALSIILYNSFETDELKQEELLEQVVQQVRAIRGPISRMLFVASRVDTFLAEEHSWPESEDEFVNRLAANITRKLREEFPEQQIEDIQLLRLSPAAAMYTYQLHNPELRVASWNRINRVFGALIDGGHNRDPNDGIRDCLREINPSEWNEKDWHILFQHMDETSGAGQFLNTFAEHIQNHLSDIILPPACEHFRKPLADAITWLRHTVTATESAIQGKTEESKIEMHKWKQQLFSINEETKQILSDFVQGIKVCLNAISASNNKAEQTANSSATLRDICHALATKLCLNPELLTPLYGWEQSMSRACRRPLHAVYLRIVQGLHISDDIPGVIRLEFLCQALRDNGYSYAVARSGRNLEEKSSSAEIDKIRRLASQYQALVAEAGQSLAASMEFTFNFENERIFDALEVIKLSYLAVLQKKYQLLPDAVRNVGDMAPPSLLKSEKSPRFRTHIQSSAKLEEWEYTSIKERSNECTDGGICYRMVVNLYRKIIGTNIVQYNVQEKILKAYIPPIRELEEKGYAAGYREQRLNIAKEFCGLINDQTTLFYGLIDGYQAELFCAYEKSLKQAEEGYTADSAQKLLHLQAIQENVDSLGELEKIAFGTLYA